MSSNLAANIPEKSKPGLIKRLVTRLIGILAVGLLIFAGVIAYDINNSDSLSMSHKDINQMLIKDTKQVNLFVKSIQKIPREIATILGLQKLRREEIKIVLDSILLNSPELFGTAVAFEPYAFDSKKHYSSFYHYREGDVIQFKSLDVPEYDYFNKDWYRLPKILKKPIWTEPYYDDGGGGVLMATYSVPFYFFDGIKESFNGIVTVDVSIDWLTHYFTANTKLPDNGFVTLISEKGTIISTPNKEWEINDTIFTLAVTLKIPELAEIGRELQQGKSGVKLITNTLSKKKTKIFYSTIAANKWGILYIFP